MSELGIKGVIVFVVIVMALISRFIPDSKDKTIIEHVSETDKEIGCDLIY